MDEVIGSKRHLDYEDLGRLQYLSQVWAEPQADVGSSSGQPLPPDPSAWRFAALLGGYPCPRLSQTPPCIVWPAVSPARLSSICDGPGALASCPDIAPPSSGPQFLHLSLEEVATGGSGRGPRLGIWGGVWSGREVGVGHLLGGP